MNAPAAQYRVGQRGNCEVPSAASHPLTLYIWQPVNIRTTDWSNVGFFKRQLRTQVK